MDPVHVACGNARRAPNSENHALFSAVSGRGAAFSGPLLTDPDDFMPSSPEANPLGGLAMVARGLVTLYA